MSRCNHTPITLLLPNLRRRYPPASTAAPTARQFMPDDHSDLVPPLPIPNRTVKRICADDSAATSVKVGHRQAFIRKPPSSNLVGGFCFCDRFVDATFSHQPSLIVKLHTRKVMHLPDPSRAFLFLITSPFRLVIAVLQTTCFHQNFYANTTRNLCSKFWLRH